jgi:ectoine hydroxylase-related dioxygenase (phytanoyl-CoA dioxygenase family)
VVDGIDMALKGLGVNEGTLTPAVRDTLERDGFTVFPSLLDVETIETLRQRVQELEREEDAWGAGTNPDDPGAIRVENLNHKGSVFDELWVHPKLLAVVHEYLGDFRLSSMTSRSPRPHLGHQRLHRDGPRFMEGAYTGCQSVWMLDDFNVDRGTTRVIPGSHRFPPSPDEELDDPWAPHPDQVLIEAPAGSLAVFNGYIWHGGTENMTDVLRRGVFTFYVRRDQRRKWDQQALLKEPTKTRLSAEACYVLDV